MTRKLLIVVIILTVLTCAVPLSTIAEVAPPATIGAPEHFGASPYYGDSVYFTYSVPEDMRNYIEKRAADDPDNKQNFSLHFQIDYKIDGGSWHYTSDWDSPKTVPDRISDQYFTFANGKKYIQGDRWSMSSLFPEDLALKAYAESGWNYLKSHSITFRIRFAESFDNGETYVLSPWSKEYTLAANIKADYNKLINHAPTLVSAEVKKLGGGEPYFEVKIGRLPGAVQDLSAMAGGTVRTEVWMRRAGEKDFKYIHYEWACYENLDIEASDYFADTKQSYDAEGYEIKIRYALDLREYKQSGIESSNSVDIYSPFSNVISHNMPAWSGASAWATPELKKADEAGLIPEILKGADMTKPITREEFAALAVRLYEKTLGTSAIAASNNPFTDTKNPEVLKAFKLGVTSGTSATTFAPKELTNREQVAAMLSRAIRTMAPDGDFSTAGAPTFTDKNDISPWAMEHVLFMSKLGIIKGTDGKFMPKATTTAQTAAGYATTTREQAIAMSVRSLEQMENIKASKPSSMVEPKPTPVPTTGAKDAEDMAEWLVGTWGYSTSNGNVSMEFMYEFKEDGNFNKVVSSMYMGARTATAYKGNYTISGDKLILSKQLKSTGSASSNFNGIWYLTMESYESKDIPAEDVQYAISRTENDMLKINDVEYNRGR
jgi:hypothetical protein